MNDVNTEHGLPAPSRRGVGLGGCLQLVTNVAEVLALLVAVLALIFSIFFFTRPDPALAILRALQNAMGAPEPTCPSAVAYVTQIPVPPQTCVPNFATVEVTREVFLIVTPTLLPPTATPPLSPSSLAVGDEWSDQRVSLKLLEVQFNFFAHFGISSGDYAIAFRFEFGNHSGETILLRMNQEEFTLTDNANREYACAIYNYPSLFEEVSEPLAQAEVYSFWVVCGRDLLLDSQVSTTALTVDAFSSLPPTVWIADVPR